MLRMPLFLTILLLVPAAMAQTPVEPTIAVSLFTDQRTVPCDRGRLVVVRLVNRSTHPVQITTPFFLHRTRQLEEPPEPAQPGDRPLGVYLLVKAEPEDLEREPAFVHVITYNQVTLDPNQELLRTVSLPAYTAAPGRRTVQAVVKEYDRTIGTSATAELQWSQRSRPLWWQQMGYASDPSATTQPARQAQSRSSPAPTQRK